MRTSSDHIVFKGTSYKHCVTDANVQVNNLMVAAAYSGSIYLDGNSISLTANNITLLGTYF